MREGRTVGESVIAQKGCQIDITKPDAVGPGLFLSQS